MSLTIEERQLIELRIRNDAPSLVVAYVMWGFLGLISAHRFYLGRPRSAVLQILSWLTVVGGFIWWLYDAVMISAYIRDDKNALRSKLVAELEGEKRGGYTPPRNAPPAEAPARAAAGPEMVAMPKRELVLDNKVGQPLMLDEAPLSLKREPINLGDEPKVTAEPAPAPLADEPKAEEPKAAEPKTQWALAEQPAAEPAASLVHEPEPEPQPAPAAEAGPTIPHPQLVDASPIEIYPRPQQPIDSLTALDEELERGHAASPAPHA